MTLCRSLPTWRWLRVAMLAGLLGAAGVRAAAAAETDYLDPAQAFRGQARVLDGQAIELDIGIAPGYHLYRDRITVEPADGPVRLGAVDLPAGSAEPDPNFGRTMQVLRGTLRVPVPAVASADFAVRVGYQGCADRGLCYAPQTALVRATVQDGRIRQVRWQGGDDAPGADAVAAAPVAARAVPALPVAPAVTAPAEASSSVDAALHSGRLPTIAAVFLLAGLLLSFTPCVLPMVPILSSIIVGQGAPVTRARGFALALAYSLGMALVYTAFGVVAGLLGEGLAAALQNPWVLGGFALLLATLSLSMFGVFELQMPSFVQSRLTETSGRLAGGRFAAVFVMGGISALIVGPCVAAPLAGALVFISRTRDLLVGGLALFSLAMGMSVPLLLVGLSAGSLLPRAGRWMEGVKVFFGVMLLAVALWIVAPVLPRALTMVLIGAGLLVGAAEAWAARPRWLRSAAPLLAVLGIAQVAGALSGGDDPLQPLRQLAARGGEVRLAEASALPLRRVASVDELDRALQGAGRPVMLDFYADWCVSCKEMDARTFSDPAVRERLAHALLLQADVTANSAADRALLKRFGLFGPPGVLFFDAAGREREPARTIGFV
ncbi:MAG: hypothetical protein ABT20_18900, partial [Rubrivivax sp. SCN 70-15]